MSLILDALNKSEQERPAQDAVPGLQSRHGLGEGPEAAAWRRLLVPALLLVVLAGLAVGIGWQPREGGKEQTRTPATAGESGVSAAREKAVPRSPATAEELPRSQTPQPQAIARQAAPVAQPVQPGVEAQESPVATDVAALYSSRAPVAAPAEPLEAPPPAVTRSPDVDAIARVAEQALQQQAAAEPLVEHTAPLIADLSQRTKDEIPSIFFSAHSWSTDPAERSVVLNGELHREGDLIKPGLTLRQILEDSIVLDYRGTEFRLRSLNSWVNL